MSNLEFRLKALTDIWTGGTEGKRDGKLHLTGIKGSIRWWYEVLVRGLGGYACDPASKNEDEKCKFDTTSFQKTKDLNSELNKICSACQLFGCTGWSGKFVLKITDNKNIPLSKQISKDNNCNFILKFIEKKELTDNEKYLINSMIKLIAEYGAIGAKTVLKPSDNSTKNDKPHHHDHGILAYQDNFTIYKTALLLKHIIFTLKKNNEIDWPNLKNFWFINGAYLNRKEHNDLVHRDDSDPRYYKNGASELDVFRGGYITDTHGEKMIPLNLKSTVEQRNTQSSAESKKIFSFHGKDSAISRCFGYTRNFKERDDIIKTIETILNVKGKIKTGEVVLGEL